MHQLQQIQHAHFQQVRIIILNSSSPEVLTRHQKGEGRTNTNTLKHFTLFQQKTTMKTLQIPVDLYTHLRNSSLSELTSIPPDDPRHREIPPEFHSISHLDSAQNATLAHNTSGSFGYPSIVYKVVSKESGGVFALRRFDNVKASQKIAAAAMAAWGGGVGTPKDIDKHPSLVKLSRAFVANRALFFVHDFHPQAKTLSQLYIGNGSEDAR